MKLKYKTAFLWILVVVFGLILAVACAPGNSMQMQATAIASNATAEASNLLAMKTVYPNGTPTPVPALSSNTSGCAPAPDQGFPKIMEIRMTNGDTCYVWNGQLSCAPN